MPVGLAGATVTEHRDHGKAVIDQIQDIESFQALRREWEILLKDSDSNCLFMTWEWLHTWWKHLGATRRLQILTLRDEAGLIAIAPFARRSESRSRPMRFNTLQFLGTGSVGSDYLDVIVRRGMESRAARILAGHLAGSSLRLEMTHVKQGGSAASVLAGELAERGWRHSERRVNVCPFINLTGQTWLSYQAGMGSGHRRTFNRKIRDLERQFAVRFEQVRTEEQRREALSILIGLHNRRWEGRGSDAFNQPGLVSFHEEMSRLALERGWLRLYVLRLDEKAAAALYGFSYGGAFSFYQSGYEPRFAEYGVGVVTLGLSIKSAIEEGLREFDLLHGGERYKSHWAREARDLMHYSLFSPRPYGKLWRTALQAQRAGKEMARRILPAGVTGGFAAARRRFMGRI